jgi:cell division protein FtsB
MRAVVIILVLLLLTLQYQLWAGRGGLPELWSLREQIEEQETENRELDERNRALEAEVEDLREGLDAIEERARSELGLVRPGESFFEVIETRRLPEEEDDEESPDA